MFSLIILAILAFMCGRSFHTPNIPNFKYESVGEERFVKRFLPKFDIAHYLSFSVSEDITNFYFFITKILLLIFFVLPLVFFQLVPWFDVFMVLLLWDIFSYNQHRWMSVTWWNEEWNNNYRGTKKYPFEKPKLEDEEEAD